MAIGEAKSVRDGSGGEACHEVADRREPRTARPEPKVRDTPKYIRKSGFPVP